MQIRQVADGVISCTSIGRSLERAEELSFSGRRASTKVLSGEPFITNWNRHSFVVAGEVLGYRDTSCSCCKHMPAGPIPVAG